MTRFQALDPAPLLPEPALLERTLSPALVVHLDRARSNVRRVLALLGGDAGRWRPHVKTTKLPGVWRLLAGEGVRHFKCATTRELLVLLETLAAARVPDADVLVAYPHVPPALARLGAIAARHPRARVSVLCEDPDLVPAIPEALGVFVDVDPGMNRTGVPAADAARIQAVAQTAGGRFRGLHWYDGHHAEADLEERTAAVQAGHARVVELVRGLERSGVPVAEVVTSGTPAFLSSTRPGPLAALAATTHRLSPGTVVFHDVRSEEECPGLGLEPAALVLCRVVSLPGPDRVTADAGTKSIAAEAGDPCAEAIGWPGLVADRPSEEHLPFRLVAGPRPARGTPLLLVPRHVCPTVNLAESALLLEEGRLVAVERVAARAHELLVDAAPGSDA